MKRIDSSSRGAFVDRPPYRPIVPFKRKSIMRKQLAFAVLAALDRLLGFSTAAARAADTAKIVLVAGRPSHGPGDHEFNAGCKLLAKCLAEVPGIEPVVVTGGWPEDEIGLRRRPHARLLHGRRRRPPDDPERPPRQRSRN